MVKDHISHAGLDILEKRRGVWEAPDEATPRVIALLSYHMVQTGQEIGAKHIRQEILLAMAKIVLQMGAFGS